MEAVLLGLGAAIGFGTSDFVAGLLSRRVHYALVAVPATIAAAAVTLVALLLSHANGPDPQAIFWGAASGIGGGFGGLMLYRGLGRGQMGVVAPLSALGTAVLPVIVGVGLGDRPSVPAWAGVVLAMPAIWLVSTSGSGEADTDEPRAGRAGLAEGVVDGLLAGVGFALLLVGLGLAGDGAGLWPVVAGETSSLILVSIFLVGTLIRLEDRRLPPRDLGGSLAVGLLGGAASILYLWSTRAGLLSIVAVITSLYPAATVVLSTLILDERIGRRQLVGLVFAAAAVVLIVLG
jgi:drug/metabolite transporter (DMT)-like permease